MRALTLCLAVSLLVSCQSIGTTASTPTPQATGSPAASPAPSVTRAATPPPAPTLTGWGELAQQVPVARSEVAATAYATVLFVIGGFGGPRAVDRYVPAAGLWIRDPDLPVEVDHAMAAGVLGGTRSGIYLIGGYVGGAASARVFRYLPVTEGGKWEEVAPMPAARAAGAAVAIGRRIYVVGGALDARTLHSSLYIYDVEANTWSVGPDMPTPRDHLAGVALGSVVCAVGGRRLTMERNLGALECYDPSLNQWRKHADMPTPRGGLGAAAVGNKIVAVGGEHPGGTFKEVEVYDATTNTWSRGQDLPHPRHGLGVVAIGRVIYAIAGGTKPGGGSETGIVEYWTLP